MINQEWRFVIFLILGVITIVGQTLATWESTILLLVLIGSIYNDLELWVMIIFAYFLAQTMMLLHFFTDVLAPNFDSPAYDAVYGQK